MSEDKKSKKPDDDSDDELVLRLGEDDSALVVRTNGQIELISKELREQQEESYVGDIDELNRTFTLVLAFAAALENESLYHDIFQNLNHVLHKQWNQLSPDEQLRIKNIRAREGKDKNIRDKEEWLNRWRDEIDRGRKSLEDYMNTDPNERDGFKPEARPFDDMETRKKPKRKKGNPLAKLKGVKWDPNDESLTAHFKDYRPDESPDEED